MSLSNNGFAPGLRAAVLCAALGGVSLLNGSASAAVLVSDGFGDGDRNNTGLDAGATATDPTDVGIPWYTAAGTSAISFGAVDDSAGIGSGNALQIYNTASNNRPTAGRFTPQSLADGESLILSFDARVVSNKVGGPTGADTATNRQFRFGLYNDTLGDFVAGDQGSTSTVYNDDNGYNARVDVGADASDNTSMDVTRDSEASNGAAIILQANAAGIGVSSTDAVNQLDDNLPHHFVLTLTRSGTSMLVSLQQDNNAAITGTDASPPSFTFSEIAMGVRSAAATDIRIDNVLLEHVVPEPATASVLAAFGAIALCRRTRR